MATSDDTIGAWYGADGQVSQVRGLLFKLSCLGATLLALLLMLGFLAYVFNDAIQPATADAGWLVTFAGTVVVPAILLGVYFYLSDSKAGEVAYTSLGLPIVSVLFAGGAVIAFRHIVTPREWLALVIAAGVAYAVVTVHGQVRDAGVLERLAVVVLAPVLAVVGVPGFSVDRTIRTPLLGQELFDVSFAVPDLVPSLRELILSLPFLPLPWISALLAFTGLVAVGVARYVRSVRESERDGIVAGVAVLAVGAAGFAVASVVGVPSAYGVIVATVVVVPNALYVEFVLRRNDGVAGLAYPVVIGAGILVGVVVVDAMGYAGPDVWLDWSFLISSHSTTPADAGIYPSLVGTVMLLTVIAVSAFPVGVGAAIYLEEYAPNQGRMGRIVELIEINIANLAGVPSVVYGVLGLALFVRGVGFQTGIVFVGGLTVGLLILPIVIVSAQESIRGVPDSMRRASYGMGATRWQTVRNVVLPEAMPGILTGTILAFGRSIGETAPLLMIGMPAVVRISPDSFFSVSSAMPRQIFTWSRLIDHDFRYGVLAAGVLTLLVVLLLMNGAAIVLRNRYQRGE
ncbi:phosphate ABC transporter permease PstA [Halopiger goleimassiliensis]|uniref:phosphate ABC transporter permease PstA n=1 Tax=Halopiger goleimassiliensis TaxID=1293048 RepID=UPI000677989E|nr:phosphate ABC transporter permease PstA [Halopiger goleimassiliensis]